MAQRVRKLAITILADNSVSFGEGLLAEHGLSLLVQAEGASLLFDVGQSGLFLGNATRLGLDLSPARKVVLSHGHYDHTGGLPLLLGAFGPREVIAHPDVLLPKYARRRGAKPRSIGLGLTRRQLAHRGAVLALRPEPQQLFPGVLTTGPIARTTDFETIPSHFAVKAGKRVARDLFEDEQGLVLHTRKGLVVLVGCSHRGLINTLRHAVRMTGDDRVYAVIGGTHLGPAGDRQLGRTVAELRRLDIAHVVACHCTGFRAAARLAADLGDRFHPAGVGYHFPP